MQLPTTVLFLLQLLVLVKLLSFFFFGGVIGCGEQVTNYHYFNQSWFTLHSLHFELSRIRLSLESFFFSTALLGTPLVIYNINLQYNTQKKKRKEKEFRSKNPKGVGATGLTSHARHGLYSIIYFCVSLQSPSMSEGPLISCSWFHDALFIVRKASSEGYLFQASGVTKGRKITRWSMWKERKIFH